MLGLRKKWTLRAHNQQVVFIKKANESDRHVLMKALIWALYLPEYPAVRVEVKIGDSYKPDVVMLDASEKPLFWGEAGEVGVRKIKSLVRRYPHTHFAMAKWQSSLQPYEALVLRACKGVKRSAPFDLLRFDENSADTHITPQGTITIELDQVEHIRIAPSHPRKEFYK